MYAYNIHKILCKYLYASPHVYVQSICSWEGNNRTDKYVFVHIDVLYIEL